MRTISAIAIGLAAAGCVVVTGSTDGYEREPATVTTRDAGTGSGNLDLRCLSATDCASDAGGQVCCVALASTSASAACQVGPCGGSLPVQLCAADSECSGSTCVLQTCTLAGSKVTVRACGTIPTCTPR